jgi:hypothetical protein
MGFLKLCSILLSIRRWAGFFASHGARAAPSPGALRFSCIIGANSERLTRSWEDINKRHRGREGTELVRLVTLDVRNLWRLQAQKGLFLDIHVDANLLEMFSLFLHIEFPWKADRKVGDERDIYPENKSHLETLLDQYFLIETYPARERQMQAIFGPVIHSGPQDYKGEPRYFINETFPDEHESWSTSTCTQRLLEPEEIYSRVDARAVTLRTNQNLPASEEFGAIRTEVEDLLNGSDLRHNPAVDWKVTDEKYFEKYVEDVEHESPPTSLGEIVRIIFDGMRNKPYTNQHIAHAIALYLVLSRHDGWEYLKSAFGDVLGVEFLVGLLEDEDFATEKGF